jgi:hypothetical protein
LSDLIEASLGERFTGSRNLFSRFFCSPATTSPLIINNSRCSSTVFAFLPACACVEVGGKIIN